MGPMTGRAAGYCAGYAVPGYMNPVGGRGFGGGWGRGRGGGRGWRNRYWATGLTGWQRAAVGAPAFGGVAPGAPFAPSMSNEQQISALKQQAEYFQDALEGIREQIDQLQSAQSKD
jgi:hypothetical protein